MDYQEVKRCDINLDTVFQIADEILQIPPSSCLVTVVTPEKPGPVLVSSSITFNTMQSDPLHAGAETDIAGIVTYKQQEDCLLSVPEQMPDDAIIEVSLCRVGFLMALSCIFYKAKTEEGWVRPLQQFANRNQSPKKYTYIYDGCIVCDCIAV